MSIKHDIALLRCQCPAVPEHVKLYGFFYEISAGKLIEVVRDMGAPALNAGPRFRRLVCTGQGYFPATL